MKVIRKLYYYYYLYIKFFYLALYGQTGAGDGNGYYQQGGVYDGVNRPPYGPPQVVEIPGYQNNWNSNTGGVAYTTYDNGVYDYGHGGYGHSSIFGGKVIYAIYKHTLNIFHHKDLFFSPFVAGNI